MISAVWARHGDAPAMARCIVAQAVAVACFRGYHYAAEDLSLAERALNDPASNSPEDVGYRVTRARRILAVEEARAKALAWAELAIQAARALGRLTRQYRPTRDPVAGCGATRYELAIWSRLYLLSSRNLDEWEKVG